MCSFSFTQKDTTPRNVFLQLHTEGHNTAQCVPSAADSFRAQLKFAFWHVTHEPLKLDQALWRCAIKPV